MPNKTREGWLLKIARQALLVLLTSLTILSLAACQRSGVNIPDGQTGDEDFQRNMHQSLYPGLTQMCETDVGIYFQKDAYLYYVDKTSKKAAALCAKPDCSHSDTSCNARLNTAGMWFTGGKLHCVTSAGEKVVLSLKPDGTGRRTVQELKFSLGASPASYTAPIYHRGYVYYVYNDVLYAVPLGGGADDARAIWGQGAGGDGHSETRDDLNLTLWADGDSVYFMANMEQPDGSFKDTLFAYDTLKGQVRQVWATPDGAQVGTWNKTGVSPSQWYVLDGSLYFFLAGNGLWRSDLDSGETVKLADTTARVPYGTAVFSDRYMCLVRDATHGDNTGGDTFFIYGLDGALLKELSLTGLYHEIGDAADCVPLFVSENDLYFMVRTGALSQGLHLCCVSIESGEITQIYTWDW